MLLIPKLPDPYYVGYCQMLPDVYHFAPCSIIYQCHYVTLLHNLTHFLSLSALVSTTIQERRGHDLGMSTCISNELLSNPFVVHDKTYKRIDVYCCHRDTLKFSHDFLPLLCCHSEGGIHINNNVRNKWHLSLLHMQLLKYCVAKKKALLHTLVWVNVLCVVQIKPHFMCGEHRIMEISDLQLLVEYLNPWRWLNSHVHKLYRNVW